jgi:hypothetical protein
VQEAAAVEVAKEAAEKKMALRRTNTGRFHEQQGVFNEPQGVLNEENKKQHCFDCFLAAKDSYSVQETKFREKAHLIERNRLF